MPNNLRDSVRKINVDLTERVAQHTLSVDRWIGAVRQENFWRQ